MKYVKNWYSILALYYNLVPETTIQFKDGMRIVVSKKRKEIDGRLNEAFGLPRDTMTWLQNSSNFDIFYEALYRRHLENNGFKYKTDERTIVITPKGLAIAIMPPYSFVLDEIFLMKVYGEPDLQGRSVVDIGASVGDSSLYFIGLGASRVFGFERDKQRHDLAQENIRLNNMTDRIQIENSDATPERLSDVIFTNGLNNVFVKLDCEGCEYNILRQSERSVFQRITDIVMEYHGKPEPLIDSLMELSYEVKKKNSILFASKKPGDL